MLAISCAKEGYIPNPAPQGDQVFFPNTLKTAITVDASVTSFSVPVQRIAADSAALYTVAVVDTTSNHAFFPADATIDVPFGAGETLSLIEVPIDQTKLYPGLSYALNFTIADNTTPYALASVKIVISVPEPWEYLGKAIFSEDLLTTFFSVEAGKQWEVEAYTNSNYPGSYFFKNAFTSEYPFNDPGDYDDTMDHYFMVNVKENGDVYVPVQYLAFDWGYGEFATGSLVPENSFSGAPESGNYGAEVNGVIKFPVKSLLISMAEYNDGGWYYTNGSGKFFIALPGAVLTDYTIGAAYGGMQVSAKGEAALIVDFTSEADAVSAKYAIALNGDAEELLGAILAGEEDGEVTFTDGEASTVIWDLEPGLYTVVAVPCDANGELHADYAVATKVKFNGLAPAGFEPQLGVYSYSDEQGSYYLTFSVNPDDPTDYLVESPSGLDDGSVWHLTFDEDAKTFTCEGLELGYESYDNQFGFGVVYGWFNKANLLTYGYVSFMESTSEKGSAPLVFNLDDSGYVTGIQNIMFGAYVYQSKADGTPTKGLGWGYLLTNEDELSYEGPASAPKAANKAAGTTFAKKVSRQISGNPVQMK